jgi:signal transduction histidine kinase
VTSAERLSAGGLVGLSILATTLVLHRLTRTRSAADRLRVEAAADSARRVRSEFLETMSHELRTPLNAIIGFSNVLLKNKSGALGARELDYVSRIAVNGTHLLGLIDDVLGFARLQSGRTTFDVGAIWARDVLESVGALARPFAQAKGITCSVQPVDHTIHLAADEARTRFILLQLTTNAIDATLEGRQVTLSCDARDGWVEIHVSDDGPVIPADELSSIFEPFTQVGRALDRPRAGVGLGMAISRELARRMGGELEVVSSEGWGSTFTLRLPSLSGPFPTEATPDDAFSR